MTDAEKLALATTFTVGDHAGLNVTVEMTDNGHGPSSGDGVPRWAIRSGRECIEVATKAWDYEPSPSSRTDKWLDAHRYIDLDQALAVAHEVLERTRAGRPARDGESALEAGE